MLPGESQSLQVATWLGLRSAGLLACVALLGGAALLGASCGPSATQHVSVASGDCGTCHSADFLRTTNPPHPGLFGKTCGDCHGQDSWSPVTKGFDHKTFFVLRGAHTMAACADCHIKGFAKGDTSKECVTCHKKDYDRSPFPGHSTFATTCADCHSETAWKPATGGDHDKFFPLDGAHLGAACSDCHTKGFAAGQTPKECVGCHQKDYDSSPLPGHGQFPTTCVDCHSTTAWKPAKSGVDHDKFFPLTDKHATLECASCHTQGFAPGQTPTDCVGCHKKDYDGSPYPGHSGFPTTCTDCHTTKAWKPAATVNHDMYFPLKDAHATVACASCHTQGFAPGQTPTDCVGCHKKDYDGSPYPGHSSFPTTCTDCHSTKAWKPASAVNHDMYFPLKDAHTTVACASCHTKGFAPGQTPTDCVGCHKKDYDGSPYPGHSSFPTTCTDCHTTKAWKPATGGGHPESKFPITTGTHKIYTCGDCHNASLGPNSKGNVDCVGCHTGAHTRAKMDAKHTEEANYPTGAAPPNFCLNCHPRG